MRLNRIMSHNVNNLFQTVVLMGALLGLLCLLGWFIAGVPGMIWALVVGVIPLLVTVRIFPSLTLKMYGARPLERCDAPKLHALLSELAARARLPSVPKLHFIESNAPVIFSIGHGATAAIAVSYAILQILTLRELAAVLAHEVSHIQNKDTWVMSLADVVSRVTHTAALLGQILVIINLPLLIIGERPLPWVPLLLMLTAPLVSALLQLALSRTREYNADFHSVSLSGDPDGLSSALEKMESYQKALIRRTVGVREKGSPSLLRTHPPTEERVRRLHELREEFVQGEDRFTRPQDLHEDLPPAIGSALKKPRRRLTGLWH